MYDICSAANRPTSGSCTTITHHNRAGGLCPVNNGGHCSLYCQNPLCSHWEFEDEEEPHSQEGSSQIIPRWAGNLAREVIPGPTQQDADNCAVNLVIVPGALNICGAMGTLDNCGKEEQCLDWDRSDKSFVFFTMVPTPDQSWGLSIYFLTVVI